MIEESTGSSLLRVPFVDLGASGAAVDAEIHEAVDRALTRTDWILGKEVEDFEHEFARYCGVAGAAGTGSGMSALELALRAFGVGPGSEVITAANTFVATALAIANVGATPVLVDVDPRSYTLDPALIEPALTSRTKAIIPVHLYGQVADMDAVRRISDAHDLIVIEDACQAHGAGYKGRRAGALGHAAAFSFYPSKNLGACGDGGMVVSDDLQILDTVRMLRNYGQRQKYVHEVLGVNQRLDTLQAAILRVKLRHLDCGNEARRRIAQLYTARLPRVGVVRPLLAEGGDSVWHLYVIQVRCRDDLLAYLARRGIASGIHYPVPVHLQPAFRHLGYERGSFPVTELASDRILSLPMYPQLPEEAVEVVVSAVDDFLALPRSEAVA